MPGSARWHSLHGVLFCSHKIQGSSTRDSTRIATYGERPRNATACVKPPKALLPSEVTKAIASCQAKLSRTPMSDSATATAWQYTPPVPATAHTPPAGIPRKRHLVHHTQQVAVQAFAPHAARRHVAAACAGTRTVARPHAHTNARIKASLRQPPRRPTGRLLIAPATRNITSMPVVFCKTMDAAKRSGTVSVAVPTAQTSHSRHAGAWHRCGEAVH
eukprot:363952-Chlamydomonas_euryale.AAC.12